MPSHSSVDPTPTQTPQPHHQPAPSNPKLSRSLLRWLLVLAAAWGVLCTMLLVAVGVADRRALRAGKQPTWPTYRVGLRVLEAIEWARDTLTPPDLRALELSYAFIDTAIVHHVREALLCRLTD